MSDHVPDTIIMCITYCGQRCDAATFYGLQLHLPCNSILPIYTIPFIPQPPILTPCLTPRPWVRGWVAPYCPPVHQNYYPISASSGAFWTFSATSTGMLCTAKSLIRSVFHSTLSQDPNSGRATPESCSSPFCSTRLVTHMSFDLYRQGFKSLCCQFLAG